jgi:hypothetical protein
MTRKVQHYVKNKEFLQALKDHGIAVRRAKRHKQEPPQVSEYLGTCIVKIAEHLAFKPNFSSYCVDTETQALTKRGWLSYSDITPKDEILSLDTKTDTLRWSSIIDLYINENFDGKMFQMHGEGIDALVTEGHKFVVNGELIPVENLGVHQHITITGSKEPSQASKYSDDFVELIGWYVTEGTCVEYLKKRTNTISRYMTFCQNEGPKAERIRKCLKGLDIIDTEHNKNNSRDKKCVWSIPVTRTEEIYNVAPNKVLSYEFITSLSFAQRDLLIQTMIDGDGWTTTRGSRLYTQKNKDHVDSFIFLCALSGIATYTSWRLNDFGKLYTVSLYNKKTIGVQRINFYGAKRPTGGDNRNGNRTKRNPTIPYKGVVWCPQTEYGTFVCKRGDFIYVTGNTFKDEMISDAIENCLIYINNFDPKKGNNPFAYYTQIAWYAFVRRINRERKQLMTKYKFIESLDLNSSMLSSTQGHDEGEYGNSHIDYLKNEVDLAYLELSKEEKAVKPKSRKPLYMNKPRVPKKKKRKTLTKRV